MPDGNAVLIAQRDRARNALRAMIEVFSAITTIDDFANSNDLRRRAIAKAQSVLAEIE